MEPLQIISYFVMLVTLFTVVFFLLLFLRHRHRVSSLSAAAQTSVREWTTPLVSVVIPAYNEGRYVRSSLESVLALDYLKDRLEVILVNDGSTDDTLEIAKEYEKYGVIVLSKKNGGKASALNFGIKKASGELLATMDADSYLTPGCLKEILPLFEEDIAAVTPAVKIRGSGHWLKELQRIEYLLILFSRKLLSYLDCVPVTPGPFSVFRKKTIEGLGGFDEKNLVEDHEIALRLQKHHYRIASSMTAEVYTEAPDNIKELLEQRVRWQRGGLHNYWDYKFLIKPEYGDFGLFFVPLNYFSITAFFIFLGLMLHSFLSQPYYSRYIWLESIGLGMGFFTLVGVFVMLVSFLFLWLAVNSFKSEKVKLRYLLGFMLFYWYLMLAYNLLVLWKELRREPASW